MPKHRHAKIVATIGPASDSPAVLRRLMAAGLDVARLNFSHGSLDEHARRIRLVRRLNAKFGFRVKLLQDLEGYRIRVGRLSRPIALKKGQTVHLTNRSGIFGKDIIPLDLEASLRDIRSGMNVFIDDGNLLLLVTKSSDKALKAKVVTPGLLKERKGINIPGFEPAFKGLTAKDLRSLRVGIEGSVDYVAQSFVRNKKDVMDLRMALKAGGSTAKVIAKIENRQGLAHFDEILDLADGIMIARGDMGVCLPIYQVPMIQKRLIRKCLIKKKMVITATQMLESMTEHPRPTRAEVSDVANAVLDGSGYLMLSGETAVGQYPVETVEMMRQIISFTENTTPLHGR